MLLASKQGRAEEANEIDKTLLPLHKRYLHCIERECLFFTNIFFRLFLESNPIPAKKALQLMGKIGYCSLGIYSESMCIHFRCVLSSSGPGIRPPLCEMSDEHVQSLTEALIIGKAI